MFEFWLGRGNALDDNGQKFVTSKKLFKHRPTTQEVQNSGISCKSCWSKILPKDVFWQILSHFSQRCFVTLISSNCLLLTAKCWWKCWFGWAWHVCWRFLGQMMMMIVRTIMTRNNNIILHGYNSPTLLTLPIEIAKMDKKQFWCQ